MPDPHFLPSPSSPISEGNLFYLSNRERRGITLSVRVKAKASTLQALEIDHLRGHSRLE